MEFEKILLSKGLRNLIVYSKSANILMLREEYIKNKDNILNTTIYGTLGDILKNGKE